MIPALKNYNGLDITFQVTEDCNLRCKYCYEVDKKPGDLPLEYAQKFIDIILTDDDPIGAKGTDSAWILEQGLILDFIGGDALMVPKLLDQILEYYQYRAVSLDHKWAYRWRASISSNGTLFEDPEVRDFMLKYKDNLSIGVSVDGCPEIHDKNRIHKDGRGTMKDIMKWWDWYMEWMGPDHAATKATCNKEMIPYLAKSIKFLHEELRLKHININFIFEDMRLTQADLNLLDEEMEKSIEYILEHRHDVHVSMFDKNFGIGGPMKDPDKGWCGSGSMPCLSINGKIYPCFRFSPNTMHSRKLDFYVGDVWNGLNHKERFEIVRSQTRKKISPQKCLDCAVESSCAWCIGGAFAEKGEFYRQTNICEVHKLKAKWASKYWAEYDRLDKAKKNAESFKAAGGALACNPGQRFLVKLEEVVLDPEPPAAAQQLLSVIVPVCNQGKYLPECLDSLLAQTYKNLEIIIVDDGSTDDSAAVSEKYVRQDARFKLIKHPANQGLSQARNTGLSQASGQYVHFLDGDDYLCATEAYEQMLGAALREDADILSGSIYSEKYDFFVGVNLEGWVRSREGKASMIKLGAPTCWRYLYKKAFLDKYNLRFDSDVPLGAEDVLFMIQAAYYSQKIYALPLLFYFWRWNKDSITGTDNPERVALFDKYHRLGWQKTYEFALEHDIKSFRDERDAEQEETEEKIMTENDERGKRIL